MVHCSMCDMEVPVGANGRCFLGHVLDGAVVASLPAPPPASPQPLAFEPPVAVAAPAVAESAPSVSEPTQTDPVVSPFAPAASVPQFIQPVPLGAPSEIAVTPAISVASPPPAAFAPAEVSAAAAPPHEVAVPPPSHQAAPDDRSRYSSLSPVALGSSALAVDPLPAEAPAPGASRDFFVVSPKTSRRPNPRLIALLALLAVVAGVFGYKSFSKSAEPATAPKAISLVGAKGVRTLTTGETHPYHARLTMTGAIGGSARIAVVADVDFTERVVASSPAGATIRYSFEHASATVDGKPVPAPFRGAALEVRTDSTGTVVSVKSEGTTSSSQSGDVRQYTEALSPLLPKAATKVGSLWTQTQRLVVPGSEAPLDIVQHLRLESLTATKATVHSAFSSPVNVKSPVRLDGGATGVAHFQGRASAAGTSVIQRSTGRLLSQKSRGQVDLRTWVEGKPGIVSTSVTIVVDVTESSAHAGPSSV